MDSCGRAALTHIELESACRVSPVVHCELVLIGLLGCFEVNRCIVKVSYPALIWCCNCYLHRSFLLCISVESNAVLLALDHWLIELNELYGVFLSALCSRFDDDLVVLDLGCALTVVEQQELPVLIICEIFLSVGEITVVDVVL